MSAERTRSDSSHPDGDSGPCAAPSETLSGASHAAWVTSGFTAALASDSTATPTAATATAVEKEMNERGQGNAPTAASGGTSPIDAAPVDAGEATPPADVRTWSPQTPPLDPAPVPSAVAVTLPTAATTATTASPAAVAPTGVRLRSGRARRDTASARETKSSSSSSNGSRRDNEKEGMGGEVEPSKALIADSRAPAPQAKCETNDSSRQRTRAAGSPDPADTHVSHDEGEDEQLVKELEQIMARTILMRPPSQPAENAQHVDPMSGTASSSPSLPRLSVSGKGVSAERASASPPVVARSSSLSPSPPQSPPTSIWDISSVFLLLAQYCDYCSLCQLMRVNKQTHQLATCDNLWRHLINNTLNLEPLVSDLSIVKNLYRFFIDEIITTRALHGYYTFVAVAPASQQSASGSYGRVHSGNSNNADVFNIEEVTLRASAATFGQINHEIGRVQLLIRYKTQSMEVLQGCCRFSPYRRCFSFSCNAFSCPVRGPVFTVAIAHVHRPWPNESPQHYAKHHGGVRLVMTPTLLEGASKGTGSLVTEADVIAVSRSPRSSGACTHTAQGTQSRGNAQAGRS